MGGQVIERSYSPRGAALESFRRRDGEVLLAGAAGTGKSRGALEKIHAVCLATDNVRALMVRKTATSLRQTGLVTFREHVLEEALKTGIVRWYGGSGDKPPAYIYSNGSTVSIGGMDKPMKIMSSEYDIMYAQEATELTPNDWEMMTSRLRNGRISFQQLIADCNPQQPSHWLKKRCDEGKTVMLYSRHEDNPVLFGPDGKLTVRGKAYIAKLDALTGVRKERLRFGRWAAAEGLIYEDWRPEVHLSDRKICPFDWPRIWGIDFGYTNPFVWQMWAIDPDGRLWLEKEIYRSKKLVEDHAKDILDVVTMADGKRWKYPRPRAIICDHDAEDRATLEKHLGMGTMAAQKTVSDGIQAMAVRLRVQADGKPRMFICRDSLVSRDEELAGAGKPLGFAQEIEGYVWEPGLDGKPVKETPRKLDDHSMDTARYVVADQDLHGTTRVRWG
jgi:PBSX family phage terminase large subunit